MERKRQNWLEKYKMTTIIWRTSVLAEWKKV